MQALRVVGIVLLSLFVVGASGVFALLMIFGVWKENSAVPYMFLNLGLIVAGIIGIVFLGRAIHHSKHATEAAQLAEPAAQVAADPLLEANALNMLRVAVGVRIGLAAATLVLQHMRPGDPYGKNHLPGAFIMVLFYQLPNAWVLWRIRERLERAATVFALCYAAIGVVWSLYYLLPVVRFVPNVSANFLPIWAVGVAAEVFVVVAAVRARALLPRQDDSVHWILSIFLALALSAAGPVLGRLVHQML